MKEEQGGGKDCDAGLEHLVDIQHPLGLRSMRSSASTMLSVQNAQ
jgi:hypothetical protein